MGGRTGRNKKRGPIRKKPAAYSARALGAIRSSWKEKSPVVKFLLAFAIGIILFYLTYTSAFFTQFVTDPFITFQARLASFFLNILGQSTSVNDSLLVSEKATLNVMKGCDGLEPIAFYLLGVLLVPLSRKAKGRGLLIGLTILVILNVFRIILLYLAQAYWPQAFGPLHDHGGPALFFIIAMLIWMAWARWAIQVSKKVADDGL